MKGCGGSQLEYSLAAVRRQRPDRVGGKLDVEGARGGRRYARKQARQSQIVAADFDAVRYPDPEDVVLFHACGAQRRQQPRRDFVGERIGEKPISGLASKGRVSF